VYEQHLCRPSKKGGKNPSPILQTREGRRGKRAETSSCHSLCSQTFSGRERGFPICPFAAFCWREAKNNSSSPVAKEKEGKRGKKRTPTSILSSQLTGEEQHIARQARKNRKSREGEEENIDIPM